MTIMFMCAFTVETKAATLRRGDRGQDVKTLQTDLNTIMNAGLAVDGSYGPATQNAVKSFQKAKGLEIDGVAGPATQKKINQIMKSRCPINTNSSMTAFKRYAAANWYRPVRVSYLSITNASGRAFATSRDNGARYHAGNEFVVSNGTPVYAMSSGTVIECSSNFWAGTGCIAVQNLDGSISRYCEVTPDSSLSVGKAVLKGAKVGAMKRNTVNGSSMLHLEMYRGTSTGSLTKSGNTTYKYVSNIRFSRRSDLINSIFVANLK